jgi:uncharacterized membrane protein
MPLYEKIATLIGILAWVAVIAAIGSWKARSEWRWPIAGTAALLLLALQVVPMLLRS